MKYPESTPQHKVLTLQSKTSSQLRPTATFVLEKTNGLCLSPHHLMDPAECTPKPHAELYAMRDKLRGILQSASSFSPSMAKPPIIDSSFDLAGNPTEDIQRQDAIKGLRALKDSVKRDLEVLEKFLADPNHAPLPLHLP